MCLFKATVNLKRIKVCSDQTACNSSYRYDAEKSVGYTSTHIAHWMQ